MMFPQLLRISEDLLSFGLPGQLPFHQLLHNHRDSGLAL
jgi:hypothetical protein